MGTESTGLIQTPETSPEVRITKGWCSVGSYRYFGDGNGSVPSGRTWCRTDTKDRWQTVHSNKRT